jgi:hypothetical protein
MKLRSIIMAGVAALLCGISAAYALTVPATFAPRSFNTQQTHYLRFTVNFNDCVLVSNTCSTKRGSVPYNAFLVRAFQEVTTSFNSGSTDTIALTTTSTYPAAGIAGVLVDKQSVHSSGNMSTLTILAGSAGINATGNGDTPTGSDGGFDIFTVYTQSSTAPTAGQAVIVLEYIAPNDGGCVTPPLGQKPADTGVGGQNAC